MSELSSRMEAIAAELQARYPERVVTRSLRDFAERERDELLAGVYTLVSLGEGGYRNYNGREALDGRQRLMLVGQIELAEDAAPQAVEDAEFELVAEVKAFLQALPPALCTLVATGFRSSGQADRPYGWVAFELEYHA